MGKTNAAPVLLQGTARNFLEQGFTIVAIMIAGFHDADARAVCCRTTIASRHLSEAESRNWPCTLRRNWAGMRASDEGRART
jgi:hypothetical protein